METVEIDGEKIEFKEGALRKQLKLKKDFKLTKTILNKLKKVKDGEKFDLEGKSFKMTPLLKKRINFALVLMKGKNKK